MEQKQMKKLYRYEIDYMTTDSETCIRLREYVVFKETESNYFIHCYISKPPKWTSVEVEKRINKTSFRKYAHETKEKAKEDFIRRTTRRKNWYKFWLDECKKGLKLIKQEK